MRVIETYPDSKVDVRGIKTLDLCHPSIDCRGATTNITGEFILIMHQHACHGKNKTIHSYPQIDRYKNIVDNVSIKVRRVQHIATLDKYEINMNIRGALYYMTLHPYIDKEWSTISHVIIT